MKIGVLGYADDVLLVAEDEPSVQAMLEVCERYGVKWSIKWNPDKTQLMKMGQPKAKDR